MNKEMHLNYYFTEILDHYKNRTSVVYTFTTAQSYHILIEVRLPYEYVTLNIASNI